MDDPGISFKIRRLFNSCITFTSYQAGQITCLENTRKLKRQLSELWSNAVGNQQASSGSWASGGCGAGVQLG
jgi:hypothetical protein